MRAWDVTDLDPLEQVVSVQRRIEIEAAPGAAPERHAMAFRMRYIWKPEMELLLERAGFARWEALTPFTDMKAEHPFDVPQPARASEMLLWRAWRDDA
jgi:hypothetical protein